MGTALNFNTFLVNIRGKKTAVTLFNGLANVNKLNKSGQK